MHHGVKSGAPADNVPVGSIGCFNKFLSPGEKRGNLALCIVKLEICNGHGEPPLLPVGAGTNGLNREYTSIITHDSQCRMCKDHLAAVCYDLLFP